MKKVVCICILFFIMGGVGCKKKIDNSAAAEKAAVISLGDNPSAVKVWETAGELKVVESIMYDRKKNVLYASCINGKPAEKNGKGYIAKVSLDGKIISLKWITGIDAPKGMGIVGDRLLVTDIDRIHEIDISAGKIIKTNNVAGAKFLNDIAIDGDGNAYITDMMTGKVHLLCGGKITEWLTMKNYSSPNGLFYDGTILFIGTVKGLVKADLSTKALEVIIPMKGGIDGLKGAGKDAFLVSDWSGRTRYVAVGKKPVVFLDTAAEKINSADIEFIPEKRLLLVPTFFHNRIAAYTIK